MKPIVSIIVPIYNVEKYIEECILSIINQTFKKIEIILVNDGANDKSMERIEKYIISDKRIKVINQLNSGLSVARNNGLKIATGKYILFVDSDDYIDKNMIKIMYNAAENENLDIVMCGYNRIVNNVIQNVDSPLKNDHIYCKEEIEELIYKAHESKFIWFVCRNLYRKKMLTENSIRFMEDIKFGEDSIFNLYAYYYAKRVMCVGKYLYNYRCNPNSLTQKKYKPYLYENIIKQVQAKLNFYKKFNLENKYKNDFNEYLLSHTLIMLINNLYNSKSDNKIDKIWGIIEQKNIKMTIRNVSIKDIINFKSSTGVKIKILLFKINMIKVINLIYKIRENKSI